MVDIRVASLACTIIAVSIAACYGGGTTAVQPLLGISDIAGEYELTRIGSQVLPAQTFPGRVTVFSGHLELLANLRFTQRTRSELCLFNSCTMQTDTVRGTWELLQDGTLYFDAELSYSWPPPRVEVHDRGREIRFFARGDTVPGFMYVRQ